MLNAIERVVDAEAALQLTELRQQQQQQQQPDNNICLSACLDFLQRKLRCIIILLLLLLSIMLFVNNLMKEINADKTMHTQLHDLVSLLKTVHNLNNATTSVSISTT